MRRLVRGLVGIVLVLVPADGLLAIPDTPVPQGGELKFGLTGFRCETITVTLGTRSLGNVIGGTVDVTARVPADMPPGEHTLKATCIGGPDTASAQVRVVGPTNGQRIALSPRSVQPGAVVTVEGTAFDDCIDDFGPNDGTQPPVQVSITLDDSPVGTVPVEENAPAKGTFRTTFDVPAGLSAADHSVVATCANRFLPGSSTATATLTVLGAPEPSPTPGRPGGGDSGGSVPQVGIGPGGSSGGSGGGIAVIGVIAVAAIGLVALRRRLRPAGVATAPPPRPPAQQRPPVVVARAAGLSSGPARVAPGPGHDVSIRVVARSGSVR